MQSLPKFVFGTGSERNIGEKVGLFPGHTFRGWQCFSRQVPLFSTSFEV